MKVLYLIDTLDGYGAEKSIVQIAIKMKEVTPVFVHLYKGEMLKPYLIDSGIKVYSLNIQSGHDYKKALQMLPPIIEKEKPQIIHSTLFRADMVGRKIKKLFPNLILVGSFVSNSYGTERYGNLSLVSKLKLFSTQIKDWLSSNEVDYFICNSNAIMKSNIKALGIQEEKIKVIYRGRHFKDFQTSNTENKIRNELPLSNNKVFLNVGRLIKSKGQLDLIEAFKKFLEKNPANILLLAGEGPLRPQLEKKINKLGLKNKVFLLGYREDIPHLLEITDFFIFPSYFEGLPGALIEAIIAKKPAIVSDIPENKECFPKGGALFFPPGDIVVLTSKMNEAVESKAWQERIESSYNYAGDNFNIINISKQYEQFYRKIIKLVEI